MSLTSYDRLFPSQDVHTGRGMGNLIAAPLNGTRRQHGTTLFLDPATLEPFDDQWAYLSSIARTSAHVVRLNTTPSDAQVRAGTVMGPAWSQNSHQGQHTMRARARHHSRSEPISLCRADRI